MIPRQPALHRTIRAIRRSGLPQMNKILVLGNWHILEDDGDLVAVNQKTGVRTVIGLSNG